MNAQNESDYIQGKRQIRTTIIYISIFAWSLFIALIIASIRIPNPHGKIFYILRDSYVVMLFVMSLSIVLATYALIKREKCKRVAITSIIICLIPIIFTLYAISVHISSNGVNMKTEYAIPVDGKPGFVIMPGSVTNMMVDVRGFPPGTQCKDPYTGRIFIVP